MVFGFEKIMNFVVDIDKLNLAKQLGHQEGDGQDHGVDFFATVYRKKS